MSAVCIKHILVQEYLNITNNITLLWNIMHYVLIPIHRIVMNVNMYVNDTLKDVYL